MVGFISEIPFSYRFATYRTAAKVRYVQRRGYLHHIDIWNVIEAFRYMFQSSYIIARIPLLLGFSLLIKMPDPKTWISGPFSGVFLFLYRKLPLMFKGARKKQFIQFSYFARENGLNTMEATTLINR